MSNQIPLFDIVARPTIRELPATERPVNRLHHYGPAALSTTELLAITIGSADQLTIASTLMAEHSALYHIARLGQHELQALPGIGPTAAARIAAAVEIGRRLTAPSIDTAPQIRSPADAANLLMLEMGVLEQEELHVLHLDTKNRVVHRDRVYKGSIDTSLIHVAEIFKSAIRSRSCKAIIAAHNHPSGDPTPSPEDVAVTKQIVAAGKLLDIELLDHLIIGRQTFVSLKERGLGFS